MKLKFSLDPPKWKIIVGFILVVCTDLYAGIQILQEGMTGFDLMKTVILIILHALIVGFMFLSKSE